MIIKMKLALQTARQCSGMRQWSTYCREEIFKQIKGVTKSADGNGYLFAGTQINVSTAVDSTGCILEFTLESKSPDGVPVKSPPIPALVFLLGMLHIAPGHKNAGQPMKFALDLGERKYTDAQWKESNEALHALLPPAWYVPYVKNVSDPQAYFQAQRK